MVSETSGRFLVFEGPDGGGKTTQASRLVAWLASSGREVVACRDPGGTPLGDRLREVLLQRSSFEPGLMAEMLLYMASRAQLIEQVIRPALARGAVVVGDRYLLSNVVYQGYAGGLDMAEVWAVGRAATAGLMPDLTIILDVPPEVAIDRTGPGRDRIEDRGSAYRARVRDGFVLQAASYPAPIVVIDGTAAPDAVAELVQTEVRRALAIPSRS